MFAKGWTKIIIILFLVMLVPILLDSFGIDIIEGVGPKTGSVKGGVGKRGAEAAAASTSQSSASQLAITNAAKIVTARNEVLILIFSMNLLKTKLTNTNGDEYKKLNSLLGSTIITNAKTALTKEIEAANLVKSALTSAAANKANAASTATATLVTDVNASIQKISDAKTGTDKATLDGLIEQMKSFNTRLTSNAKIIKDSINILLINTTGKAALATIK